MGCLTGEALPKLYSLTHRGKGTQKRNTPEMIRWVFRLGFYRVAKRLLPVVDEKFISVPSNKLCLWRKTLRQLNCATTQR